MSENNVVCNYGSVVDEPFTHLYSESKADVNGIFYRCGYIAFFAHTWKNS